MRIPLIVATATLLMSQSALAQNVSPGTPQRTAPNSAQSGTPNHPQSADNLRAQIQKNLQAAGFTDIQIMPSSFLVRAKDRDGNPMMMVINPDSVTAVTEMGSQGNANQGNANQGTTNQGTTNQRTTTGSANPNQNSSPTRR